MQERGYDPGFHEILGHSPLPAPPKLESFCWNIWFYKVLGGFQVKFTEFHMKSAGFHEIHQISGEIHMKSAGFHEIRRISWMWAFGRSPSIGLSFERPMRELFLFHHNGYGMKLKLQKKSNIKCCHVWISQSNGLFLQSVNVRCLFGFKTHFSISITIVTPCTQF